MPSSELGYSIQTCVHWLLIFGRLLGIYVVGHAGLGVEEGRG